MPMHRTMQHTQVQSAGHAAGKSHLVHRTGTPAVHTPTVHKPPVTPPKVVKSPSSASGSALVKGDTVTIVKKGTHYGKSATVLDAEWQGIVKVDMARLPHDEWFPIKAHSPW